MTDLQKRREELEELLDSQLPEIRRVRNEREKADKDRDRDGRNAYGDYLADLLQERCNARLTLTDVLTKLLEREREVSAELGCMCLTFDRMLPKDMQVGRSAEEWVLVAQQAVDSLPHIPCIHGDGCLKGTVCPYEEYQDCVERAEQAIESEGK